MAAFWTASSAIGSAAEGLRDATFLGAASACAREVLSGLRPSSLDGLESGGAEPMAAFWTASSAIGSAEDLRDATTSAAERGLAGEGADDAVP